MNIKGSETVLSERLSKRREILFAIIVIAMVISAFVTASFVNAAVEYIGSNEVYKSGSMKIYIKDDASGKTTTGILKVSRDSAPSRSTFENKSTKWNCVLTISGTNNHNLKLNQTTVSTKLTSDGYYMIMNFSLSYTQHANYKYSSVTKVEECAARMNFCKYATDTSTIVKGYTDSDITRTVNFQVHSCHLGIATDKQRRYSGNSVSVNYTRPSYQVTFSNGSGTILKTQNVLRGASASAPAEPSREGYSFEGWDKAFDVIKENTDVSAVWAQIPAGQNSYHIMLGM